MGENGQNNENIADVLNREPQQQVPVPQIAVLDNKLPYKEDEQNANKNGVHSESTSSTFTKQTRESSVEKKATSNSSQKTVTTKCLVASDTAAKCESMKEGSGKTEKTDWQGRKYTVKCLEGHNDLITSVDMDGSFLISGRCVSFKKPD